ncbi:hypothetical protein [Tetragenococcus halophilus]|uniref:hypothetical protein n=1 Tax=Tetragenococcus halophilus TaxID=51669 RepID=UPI0030E9C6EA
MFFKKKDKERIAPNDYIPDKCMDTIIRNTEKREKDGLDVEIQTFNEEEFKESVKEYIEIKLNNGDIFYDHVNSLSEVKRCIEERRVLILSFNESPHFVSASFISSFRLVTVDEQAEEKIDSLRRRLKYLHI